METVKPSAMSDATVTAFKSKLGISDIIEVVALNTAKTGITTAQDSAIATNTAKVTSKWFVDGTNEIYSGKFTKLGGTGAPAIKQALITGTTGVAASLTSNTTNIAKSNIISFTVHVDNTSGSLTLPSYGASGTDAKYYSAVIYPDGNLYIYIPSTSTEVAECDFTCLITYTE